MRVLRLFALAPLVFLGQMALAHTELAGSIPAADSTIEAAPEEVMLHFSAPVRLTALAIQREGEDAERLGPVPTDPAEHFTIQSPELNDGPYTVSWRALSDDTHTMTGEFSFVVGKATGTAPQMDHGDGHQEAGETHGEHDATNQ